MVNDVQSRSGIAQIRENVVEFSRPIEERANLTDFEDHALKQKIEGLWKTDFGDTLVNTRPSHSVEDKRALQMMENSFVKVNGHYQVALPWRSYPPNLHDNRELAVKRCESLKRRLLNDGDLAAKYKAAMTDYIEKGHAKRVPHEESKVLDKPVWYLPHHPVTHPLKPEKVRVVYDCAAKYNQMSLNHELLQGPDETNRLVGVISRFRMESIGVMADIESMFNQVIVDPKDRDVLRFLWWPDGDLSKDLAEYRMTKHVFGAKSSPSIADFCVRITAELESDGIERDVVDTVKRNMYVDDLMKSSDMVEKAIRLVDQLRELLSRGGFRLTKWCSNKREVLSTIPEEERAKSVANLEIEQLPIESTLGLKWNAELDQFVWEISKEKMSAIYDKPVTRRSLLSVIYSVFDPLGFIAPFTMKAKLLLQTLCRKKVTWDADIEEPERAQWERWIGDLADLENVHVNRCFKPDDFGKVETVELHVFSYASRVGYAAVAYLRFVNTEGRIWCAFVIGKTRLAPVREISIPRLELSRSAAVVSVKLRVLVQRELDMILNHVYHWTDSTSVLKCINNETKRFHTFESNRLTVILNESSRNEWRYVNTDVNSADDGSKGMKLRDFLKNDRWIAGPPFLWKEKSYWPKMIDVPEMKDDDPELRKEVQVYVTTNDEHPVDKLIEFHSSWWKLKKCVAWLMKYKSWLLKRPNGLRKHLTVNARFKEF